MIAERHAVTGDRIEGRQRIFAPGKQPVASLVADHKDDVVGLLAAGERTLRSSILRPRKAARETYREAHACYEAQGVEAESLSHVAIFPVGEETMTPSALATALPGSAQASPTELGTVHRSGSNQQNRKQPGQNSAMSRAD